MAKKSWAIYLEDGKHEIKLDHGYFSGRRIISLDGRIIEHIKYNLIDYGSNHEFNINNHHCVILIKIPAFYFSYDLIVDGKSVETGLPVYNIEVNRPKTNPSAFLSNLTGFIAASFISGYMKSLAMPFILAVLIYIFVYLSVRSVVMGIISRVRK